MIIIIYFVFVIFLTYAYIQIHYSTQSRLIDKMFPGPPRLSFIGTVTLKMISPEGFHQYFLDSSKSYNYRPYRIWIMNKPYMVVPDFRLARVILSKLKFTDKADFYEAFVPWIGRNHLVGSGEAWLRYRKHDLHAFRYKEMIQFLRPFNKNCNTLCLKLSTHDGKEAFDVTSYISKYSLDNICGTIFGTELQAQNSEHCPYAEALETMNRIVALKLIFPILRVDWIFNLTPLNRWQKDCIKTFRDYSGNIIRERRALMISEEKKLHENNSGAEAKNKNEPLSFMDRALKENKANYTDEEIQIEVESAMLAGHESGTSSLIFLLYTLAERPDIQEKVYEEIRGIFGDSTTDLNVNQLNQMKYTEQVIRETLRYYSPAPILGRRINENLYINEKQFIPKGTNVIIHIAGIQRDPINWPNADIFDPERFSQESSCNRDPYAFLAFSAGPRNCLGYHMAMLSLKLTTARVIQKFELSSSGNPQHKIRPAYNIFLTSANGCNIKIKLRKNKI